MSYTVVHNKNKKKESATYENPLQTAVEDVLKKKGESLHTPEENCKLTLFHLVILQSHFYTIYTQMWPQHSHSHRQHELKLYTMYEQKVPMTKILKYDDIVRRHFMENIPGEAWVLTDFNVQNEVAVLLNSREDIIVKPQQQGPKRFGE